MSSIRAGPGVVRQVVLSLLGPGDDGPTRYRLSPQQPSRSRPLWQTLDDAGERDRPPWLNEREEEEGFLSDGDRDHDLDNDLGADLTPTGLWRQVLAAALPALGWWLYRQAGRQMVGAAVGFGVVCGLALYYGGRKNASTGLALALLTESVAAAATLAVPDER